MSEPNRGTQERASQSRVELAATSTERSTETEMTRFYRNEDIEEVAAGRLAELEQHLGRPLTPPIPIDFFVEKVLGLSFL